MGNRRGFIRKKELSRGVTSSLDDGFTDPDSLEGPMKTEDGGAGRDLRRGARMTKSAYRSLLEPPANRLQCAFLTLSLVPSVVPSLWHPCGRRITRMRDGGGQAGPTVVRALQQRT